MHFRMVLADGLRDVLQQDRFSGSGRRHDQAALSLADGSEKVQDAGRHRLLAGFEPYVLVRVDWRQFIPLAPGELLGGAPFNALDGGQTRAAAFSGRLDWSGKQHPLAKRETLDQRRRHVRVVWL